VSSTVLLQACHRLKRRSVGKPRETIRGGVDKGSSTGNQVGHQGPAPGPRPKPWPEKPVTMYKPGTLSTFEITGRATGVASIRPTQRCLVLPCEKTGNAVRSSCGPWSRLASRERANKLDERRSSGRGADAPASLQTARRFVAGLQHALCRREVLRRQVRR
jgi:hypothetical protein